MEIKVDGDWQSTNISGPSAELSLPQFGLKCVLGQLYEGTPLRPRTAAPRH